MAFPDIDIKRACYIDLHVNALRFFATATSTGSAQGALIAHDFRFIASTARASFARAVFHSDFLSH